MNQTNGILIVLALLVLGAAGYLLFGRTDAGSALSPDAAPASAAEVEFLNLAAQIEPVKYDVTVLSDPRFLGLQDLRTPIVSEASGRTDPFAPLGN